MKWNVILQDTATGKFQPYNIFEYRDFRLSMENLFKKQYPEEHFLKELDLEIHYYDHSFRCAPRHKRDMKPKFVTQHSKICVKILLEKVDTLHNTWR